MRTPVALLTTYSVGEVAEFPRTNLISSANRLVCSFAATHVTEDCISRADVRETQATKTTAATTATITTTTSVYSRGNLNRVLFDLFLLEDLSNQLRTLLVHDVIDWYDVSACGCLVTSSHA